MNFTSPNTIYPLPKHFSSKGQTFTFLGGEGGLGWWGNLEKSSCNLPSKGKSHAWPAYICHALLFERKLPYWSVEKFFNASTPKVKSISQGETIIFDINRVTFFNPLRSTQYFKL